MRKLFSFIVAALFSVSMMASWTVAGSPAGAFGEVWVPAYEANDMELVEGLYQWAKTDVTLAAGTIIEFKVVKDHKWGEEYPAQNYQLAIEKDGKYNLTITFDETTKEVTAKAELQEGEVILPPATIKLMGELTDWTDGQAFTLSQDETTAGLTINVAETGSYQFKIVVGDGGWRSSGGRVTRDVNTVENLTGNDNDNMTLVADVAGDYTFTWTYETKTLAVTFPEGEIAEPELENGYYLVGSFNNWTPSSEYIFDENPEVGGEYVAYATLAEGDEFKVAEVLMDAIVAWYPDGDNYVVDAAHAGAEKAVYFRKDGNGGDDWFGKMIFVPANEEPVAAAWSEIIFTEIAANGTLDGKVFKAEGSDFALTLTDTDNKQSIDANNAHFLMANEENVYAYRLKAGGKSSSKNAMVLTIPADGKLRVAVRTGSNSATDRNLVLTQGGVELYNQVVVESDATQEIRVNAEDGDEYTVNLYPYVTVEVKAGTVEVAYPTNSLNFYAFGFLADEKDEPIVEPTFADGYYLLGTLNSWSLASEYLFAANAAAPGEYHLDVTLAEGDEFKVVKVASDTIEAWYPEGMGNNYIVDAAHAGAKTVYFRPDKQGGEDWYEKVIFVPANAEPVAGVWSEIIFTEIAEKGTLDGKVFQAEGSDFALTLTDTDGKQSIDANNAHFLMANEENVYAYRLKTGGKSSSKNAMVLTIPADGKLRVAVRSGNNDATDRNLVLTQGGLELYNQVVVESDATQEIRKNAEDQEYTVNLYPYVTVEVRAGKVEVAYPTNGLNFYAFGFLADEVVGPTGMDNTVAEGKAVKMIENGMLVIEKNGVKYNVMGQAIR